jgi:hypothetical protein
VYHRRLHIVRKREQTEALQKIRAAELRAIEGLVVHYNDDPWSLGVELAGLLGSGEVVAVLADRAVPGLSSITLPHEGLRVVIPEGPLVLAQIARVPCFPVFLTRVGVCRYHARFGSPICDIRNRVSAETIGKAWLPAMIGFLRGHFDQWFVFEKVITR